VAGGYSYNGWPASDSASAINVNKNFVGGGETFPGGMKAGDVDTVMGYVFDEIDKRVEAAVPGWNWGWSYRANVNNPSQLSNHSSATAGDYNAPNHPNGTSTGPNGGGGWSSSQYKEIQKILAEVEYAVNWLTGNDPMHFDIQVNASVLAGVASRIRAKEDDMSLSADDKTWINNNTTSIVNAQLTSFLRTNKFIITNDRASTPNDVPYSFETGMERLIRIVTGTYVGETGKPHND
jgi:hypothetical protein